MAYRHLETKKHIPSPRVMVCVYIRASTSGKCDEPASMMKSVPDGCARKGCTGRFRKRRPMCDRFQDAAALKLIVDIETKSGRLRRELADSDAH